MLEVSGLSGGYGQITVLRSISLKVLDGEIVALLGSNGAGKTTLNNALSGIIRPTAGGIRFFGTEIAGAPPEVIVEFGLVHVPEGRKIFPNMSVRENLELGSYRRAKTRRRTNIDRVTTVFPRLKERMHQLAGTLSGGEQQMLAIGRGMMAEPRLLILDEPSLGLSPLLVDEMFALIGTLKDDGLSILLVEQNVVQSLQIADRGYVMEHGEIRLTGTSEMLLQNEDLRRSYLGL